MLESPVNFEMTVKAQPSFQLIGLETVRLSLQPQEELTIPLEALVPSAGAHDLQALHLSVKRDQDDLPFPMKQQWLVFVSDISS